MWAYPLQSVLDLRCREEAAAAESLAVATQHRLKAEENEERLRAAVDSARSLLERAQAGASAGDGRDSSGSTGSVTAGETAAGAARFVERRRAELGRARAALTSFRRTELAEARGAETAARAQHLAARRAHQAFQKHAEKHRAAARLAAERREEEVLEDVARAAQHGRQDRGDR